MIWDGSRIPLEDASVDSAMATEVLEHCPDPLLVLREIRRVIKPGGVFFFTVPFLWPLHDVPRDEYRYTPFALERLLEVAGFSDIQVEGLGGWDASLAQVLGLWARRRPMQPWKRSLVSRLLVPLLAWLLKTDRTPDRFVEGTMCLGFCGTARIA